MSSRTRVNNDIKIDAIAWTSGTPNPTPSPNVVGSNYARDIMTDVVNPGFNRLRREGVIFNNPMVHEKVSCTVGSGSRHAVQKSNPSNWGHVDGNVTGYFQQYDNPTFQSVNIDIDNERRSAILSAISNMDKTPYAFMEDLLEFDKTAQTLRKPLGSMMELAHKYQHELKRKSKFLSTVRAASNAWLTVNNGYRPLIQSSLNIVEAMSDRNRALPRRLTSRGTYADSVTSTSSTTVSGRTYTHWESKTASGKITILYEVTNPARGWRADLGLRNKDIPAGIWAVMPYSWVIDRVVNISNSVQGLTNLLDPNIKVLMACDSRHSITREVTQLVSESQADWTISLNGNQIIIDGESRERSPISLSISDLVPPVEIQGLFRSLSSIADVASLVGKRLKG